MNIFLDFKGASVNISKIREINVAQKESVHITFDDGSADIYYTYGDAEKFMEQFNRTILQLIPCTSQMYNVYKDGDDTYFHEDVRYLALCADGGVRTLAGAYDYLELAEEASNYVGCFEVERLKDYPESVSEA